MLLIVVVSLLYIGSNDYISVDTDLIFDACDNHSCIDIVIEDDCLVERLDERFSVVLDRGVGMVESIRLEPATGYVIIIDTDSKCGISSLSTHSLTSSLITNILSHSLSFSPPLLLLTLFDQQLLLLSSHKMCIMQQRVLMMWCMCVLLFVVVILNLNLELLYPLKAELQVRNYYNTH